MSLKIQLTEDLKTAMKQRDSVRKDTVQMTRAAVLQLEKDRKIVLDDDGIIDVISKEVKKRKDALPDYEKSGRDDLVERLKEEIDVLEKYLPQQLTEDELDKIVSEVINETGAVSAKDMGKVMQAVLVKVRGRADGKAVNNLVRKYLN